jgi:glycosyltransferase involved in cell wall biosynthesis
VATLPPNFTLLQVVPELDAGGAEQSALDINRAVTRAGGRSLAASKGGRLVARLEADGGTFVPLPVDTKNPLTAFRNALALAALVRRQGVSVMHVRSRAPAFSVWLASRMTGVPWLATYHGAYPAKSSLKRWYNSVMTRGRLTIANSAFTRAHLLSQHRIEADKVVTIPRGIDLERFDPAAVDEGRLRRMKAWLGVDNGDPRVKVLLAGRLTRLKGQLVLVGAMARLKARGRNDILVLLVGDDQGRTGYRAEVEDAIDEAGLGDRVRLFGHCDDMPAAYLAADLVAVPSTVPETFGRTAVEPQVMGRPVIASALGGLTETVIDGETGWLVPPVYPDAWAEALAAAVDAGPARRAEMGALGRERCVKLYSVETMAEATLEAYARVLAE